MKHAADNVRLMAEQGTDFENGFRLAREHRISEARILQFHKDMESIRRGRLHPAVYLNNLRETQGINSFPLLMADSIDRSVLMGYQEAPASWPSYCWRKVNRDFRAAKLFAIDGGEGVNEVVNELGPYPATQISESKYEVSVLKYGDTFAYSFEMFINDDLGAFMDTPRRMGRKVRRTEEDVATKLYATDAAKAAFFTAGNNNLISGNPILGIEGLNVAINVMAQQLDADGEPIEIEGAVVVYPPALRAAVLQIANLTEVRASSLAGDSDNLVVTTNYMRTTFTFVENKRLPLVAETNADTGWFVFANPSLGRPALVLAFLMGHESPDLFIKAPDSVRVGGGMATPMDGSFANDSIQYKVRNFVGGSRIDPKAACFSNGSGS